VTKSGIYDSLSVSVLLTFHVLKVKGLRKYCHMFVSTTWFESIMV